MPFDEFQASARVMTGAEYEAAFGANLTIADLLEEGDRLRVYGDGFWIAELQGGDFLLLLGDDAWMTSPEGPSLSDLERRLWERAANPSRLGWVPGKSVKTH